METYREKNFSRLGLTTLKRESYSWFKEKIPFSSYLKIAAMSIWNTGSALNKIFSLVWSNAKVTLCAHRPCLIHYFHEIHWSDWLMNGVLSLQVEVLWTSPLMLISVNTSWQVDLIWDNVNTKLLNVLTSYMATAFTNLICSFSPYILRFSFSLKGINSGVAGSFIKNFRRLLEIRSAQFLVGTRNKEHIKLVRERQWFLSTHQEQWI